MVKRRLRPAKSAKTAGATAVAKAPKKRKAAHSSEAEASPRPGKQARTWRQQEPSVVAAANGFHVFEADPLDHAETELRAYSHIKPLLELLAKQLCVTSEHLQLWDPYYCQGAVVKNLAHFGFAKVHNRNEDFYAIAKSGRLPNHDVLLSNPPYSGDHLERCLMFCAESSKPCLLLLPNWVARKPYFSKSIGKVPAQLFFIAPVERYTYVMPPKLVQGRSRPDWVGEDGQTSPYNSAWYIYLPHSLAQRKIYETLELQARQFRKEWMLARTIQALKWKLKKAPAALQLVNASKSQRSSKDFGTQKVKQAKKKKAKQGSKWLPRPGTIEFD